MSSTNESQEKSFNRNMVLIMTMGCLIVTLGALSLVNSCLILNAKEEAERKLLEDAEPPGNDFIENGTDGKHAPP